MSYATLPLPSLRLALDDLGRARRVFVDDIEITRLVTRVNTTTTPRGSEVEVVLRTCHAPVRPSTAGAEEATS